MAGKEDCYVPGPDFKEDRQPPLFDIHLNDNTELWLVQLPGDHFPDFESQEISLDLDPDGEMGSIKGANGKVYSLVSFPSDVAETIIFQPCQSGTRIVGKVSRHVSLVHFPEPDELGDQKLDSRKTPMPSKTMFTKSRFSTPQPSSRHKSDGKVSSSSKRAGSERSLKTGLSAQDSGRGHSSITVSGSSEQSHHKKSKTGLSTQDSG